ncbi:MAG: hypothetical protein JSU87_02340 [Gemmatimonadota bacterium]|nr:MAG: hypothetical protein JSU87_02340 [Gemmatimonadota bacterium]
MSSSKLAWFRQVPLVALALSFSFLAACDDDGGPGTTGTDVDPTVANAVLDSVLQSFIDDNPSAQAAGGPIGGFITALTSQQPVAPPTVIRMPLNAGVAAGGTRVSEILNVLRLASAPGSPLASASIPSNLVGATCVWNFDTSAGWLDDTSRRGLCGTGNCIRFALYPLGADGLPNSQTEIGYIDITDETILGGGGVFNINVTILSQADGVTALDYGVSGTLSETTVNLTMSGTLSDATSTLPIVFTILGSPADFSTSFGIQAGGFAIGLTFAFNESTGYDYVAIATDLTNDDEIRIVVGVDFADSIKPGSEIAFNGQTVATLSGTADFVTATAVEGSGLTAGQLQAFVALFGTFQEFFGDMAGLFAFAVANTGNTVIIE